MSNDWDDYREDYNDSLPPLHVISIQKTKQQKSGYSGHYPQNFMKEATRLANDWYNDNEDMELMEYIDYYAPEEICDNITFEIVYPNGISKEKIESQILFNLQKERKSK